MYAGKLGNPQHARDSVSADDRPAELFENLFPLLFGWRALALKNVQNPIPVNKEENNMVGALRDSRPSLVEER